MRRYRCNLSFDGHRAGELVDGDPQLAAPYVKRGWLSEVEDGQRVIDGATWTPGDEDDPDPRLVEIADQRRYLSLAQDDPRRIEAERIIKERSGRSA